VRNLRSFFAHKEEEGEHVVQPDWKICEGVFNPNKVISFIVAMFAKQA